MKKIIAYFIILYRLFSFEIMSLESLQEETNSSSNKSININIPSFSGEFNDKLSIKYFEKEAPINKDKIEKDEINKWLSENKLSLKLNMESSFEKFKLNVKSYFEYYNENNNDISLYEMYLEYNPSFSLTFNIGKKSIYYGKGYAFNPIGILNPEKDPDNPEEEGLGKNSLSMEYTKSFNYKYLNTYSLNTVFFLNNESENNNYDSDDSIDLAFKNYFLIFNSDVDLIGYINNRDFSIGLDFSTNLLPQLEIHGEYIYGFDTKYRSFDKEDFSDIKKNTASYLAGLKYLNKYSTSFILEYYHNGKGISSEDYKALFDYVNKNNLDLLSVYKNFNKNPFKDYLYLKISQPEPFSILYTSISYTNIFNLKDNSSSNKISFVFSPYNNINYGLNIRVTTGKNYTEFGDKRGFSLEAELNYFF